MALPPVVRRIVEAGGIARTGAGYRPDSSALYLEADLPVGTCPQFIGELRAAGWFVTVTPTNEVLR